MSKYMSNLKIVGPWYFPLWHSLSFDIKHDTVWHCVARGRGFCVLYALWNLKQKYHGYSFHSSDTAPFQWYIKHECEYRVIADMYV